MTLEKTVPYKEWRIALEDALALLDKRIRTMVGDTYIYEYIVFGDVAELVHYKASKYKHLKIAVAMYQTMPEDETGRIVLLPRTVIGYFPALDDFGEPLMNANGLPQVAIQSKPIAWLEYPHNSKPFSAPQFKIAQPELAFLIKLKD